MILEFELDHRLLFAGVKGGSAARDIPFRVLVIAVVVPEEVIIACLVVTLPITFVVEQLIVSTIFQAFEYRQVGAFTWCLKTERPVASELVPLIVVKLS